MSRAVGRLAWAARSGGRLDWRDRLELQLQAVRLRMARSARAWRQRLHPQGEPVALPWPEVTDIRMPDSALARRALECASDLSPPWLLNHCLRTWLWAELLARRQGKRLDRELLFVASVLHDLGLTAAHDGHAAGCHCFAVEGAEAARRFVLAAGAGAELADAVCEAISLHLNPRVPMAYGAEAHYLNAGAALDVVGAGMRTLPSAIVATVVTRHPWLNFGELMAAATQGQAVRRPESRAAFLVEHGFLDMIRTVPRR